jgi:hypothetical protein
MKLTIRPNDQKGFAGGVEKVQYTGNAGSSNNYTGIDLLNFEANSAKRGRVDNFLAEAM